MSTQSLTELRDKLQHAQRERDFADKPPPRITFVVDGKVYKPNWDEITVEDLIKALSMMIDSRPH